MWENKKLAFNTCLEIVWTKLLTFNYNHFLNLLDNILPDLFLGRNEYPVLLVISDIKTGMYSLGRSGFRITNIIITATPSWTRNPAQCNERIILQDSLLFKVKTTNMMMSDRFEDRCPLWTIKSSIYTMFLTLQWLWLSLKVS